MALQEQGSCSRQSATRALLTVCYKYSKQYEPMLADARESCKLEPTVPTHYFYCAVAMQQLGRHEELLATCEAGLGLEMPDTLRQQLTALRDAGM